MSSSKMTAKPEVDRRKQAIAQARAFDRFLRNDESNEDF